MTDRQRRVRNRTEANPPLPDEIDGRPAESSHSEAEGALSSAVEIRNALNFTFKSFLAKHDFVQPWCLQAALKFQELGLSPDDSFLDVLQKRKMKMDAVSNLWHEFKRKFAPTEADDSKSATEWRSCLMEILPENPRPLFDFELEEWHATFPPLRKFAFRQAAASAFNSTVSKESKTSQKRTIQNMAILSDPNFKRPHQFYCNGIPFDPRSSNMEVSLSQPNSEGWGFLQSFLAMDEEITDVLSGQTDSEFDDFGALSESDVQNAANSLCEAWGISVSVTFGSDSSPMMIQRANGHLDDQHHVMADKADLAGLKFPSACELKKGSNQGFQTPFWDAMDQAIERLQVVTETHGYLRRFTIFALAPPTCCAVFALSEYKHNQMSWKVHLVRIEPGHLFPLWATLQQRAENDPTWFLHPEAGCLQKLSRMLWSPAISQPVLPRNASNYREPSIYLPLSYFSVQFEARSSSGTVFLLNAPETVEGRKCGLFRHTERTLVVKLFTNEEDFQNEVISLEGMAKQLQLYDQDRLENVFGWQDSSDFFPLASLDLSDAKARLNWFSTVPASAKKLRKLPVAPKITKIINLNNEFRKKSSHEEIWWGTDTFSCSEDFKGVLLMKEGKPLNWEKVSSLETKVELKKEIQYGVLLSLQLLHACGRVHRDVRSPNVLFFNGHAQLIDFGYSAAIGEEQEEAPTTSRKMVPLCVWQEVPWTRWGPEHDHLLLHDLLRYL